MTKSSTTVSSLKTSQDPTSASSSKSIKYPSSASPSLNDSNFTLAFINSNSSCHNQNSASTIKSSQTPSDQLELTDVGRETDIVYSFPSHQTERPYTSSINPDIVPPSPPCHINSINVSPSIFLLPSPAITSPTQSHFMIQNECTISNFPLFLI